MQKKLLLGLLVVFLLAIPFCHAESKIKLDVSPLRNKVLSGEWAAFNISITNLQMTDDTFVISVKEEGVDWSVLTASTVDYSSGIRIGSGETKTTTLLLKDKGLRPYPNRPYSVGLKLKSLNMGNEVTELLPVYIVSEMPVEYDSDINVSPRIPRYIDPRNVYSFKLALYNNNKKDIKDLKINLESALVKREAEVELEPESRKVVEFTVDFDEETKPVMDTMTVTVSEGHDLLYRSTSPMEVVGYRMPFKRQTSTEEHFLKDVTTITLTNDDNVGQEQTFLIKRKASDVLFTSTSPEATVVEKGDETYYSWDVQLEPDKSASVALTTNYRIPFYALIVMIAAAVIYIYIRDPAVVLKNCDTIKTKEGGINELKVVIAVKNRTNEKIKNARLVDYIPRIAHVEKKKAEGTLKPSRTVNTNKGVALEWNFDMDPKEERLIYYYIRSRLSILGGMKLPKAVLILKRKGKDQQKVRSNNVHVAGR